MNFREFIKVAEAAASIMGGPNASGRLGQSQSSPEKPVTNPSQKSKPEKAIPPSPFNASSKGQVKPSQDPQWKAEKGKFGLGIMPAPNPLPPSPFSYDFFKQPKVTNVKNMPNPAQGPQKQ